MNTIINYRSLLLTFVTVFCLSACSVRITYNYLDWLIPWYADDYVSLNERQEKLFKHKTMQLLGWHRTNELPRYADFLNRIRNDVGTELTQSQVISYFDEGHQLWISLVSTSMPALLELAKSLSDEQVEELVASLAEDIKDIEKENSYLDDGQRRNKWRENMDDALDDWLGSVTQQQAALVNQWSEKRLNTYDQWVAYRKAWHSRFADVMVLRNHADFDNQFESLLLDPKQFTDDSYRVQNETNRNQFAQLLADLSHNLTERQRKHLQNKIEDLKVDLKELSEKR